MNSSSETGTLGFIYVTKLNLLFYNTCNISYFDQAIWHTVTIYYTLH